MTKAVLTLRVSVEHRYTVAIPNGLTPHYLVAALNAKSASEIGDFLICPDTFSARVEGKDTEYGEARWEIQSADEPCLTEGGDSSADALRAAAQADAGEAAAKQRRWEVLWRVDSLNRLAIAQLVEGKYNEARKFVSAASLIYQLSGEGDCDEAVWLHQCKAFNAAAAKKHKATWRHGKLAIEMARRLHTPHRNLLGVCLANVGEALLNVGDAHRAELVLTEAVKVLDEATAAGANNPATISGAKAEALQNLKKIEESKVYTL